MKTRFFFHVVTPLMIGGVIYVCWRDPSLRLFDWLDLIGFGSTVQTIRSVTVPVAGQLPHWLLYSLPDALWVYATIMFMHFIWNKREGRSFNRRLWLLSGPVLAIVIELGQLVDLVPGDFDPFDLLLSAAASAAAALVIIKFSQTRNRIEKGTQYVQANKNELAVGSRA